MHAVPSQPFSVTSLSAPAPERRAPPATEIDSTCLLEGRREVLIRHGGECYRLRHTRNDKLILTK